MVGGSSTAPGRDADGSEGSPSRGSGDPIPPPDLLAAYPFRWERVAVGGAALGLFTLPDPDALLDALTQEEFDRNDGRMPYWATLWPSAFALAERLLAGPALPGRRVIVLGCGLGLEGLAACARGAQVTFLDWEPVAVACARASAAANGWTATEGVVCDWRAPPPLPAYDLVLGADVLYEARNGPAVARFLAAHLARGGEAWITDPERLHAKDFPADLAAAGLALLARDALPPRPDASRLTLWRVGAGPEAARP